MLVVEPEAEQHVRVLEFPQVRPLQEALVFLDGASDLTLLAIQVAENEMNLERIARRLRPRCSIPQSRDRSGWRRGS